MHAQLANHLVLSTCESVCLSVRLKSAHLLGETGVVRGNNMAI